MNRFLLLVLLNLPLIIAGMMGSLIDFKTGKITRTKFILLELLWLAILAGLVLAGPINNYLYEHHKINKNTLSLFDVIETTGIIYILFMANRARIKVDTLERRVQDLHQELSIRLSAKK